MLRLTVLFVVGGLLGTLGDSLHVAGGVLGYPGATVLGEKPWVPLLMGASTLALVEGHAFWRARWPRRLEQAATGRAALGVAAFLAAWGATALAWRHPEALTLALIALYFAWPDATRPDVLLFALSTAALGPGVEATLSFVGGFEYYTGRLLFGVPAWLPALYLHAAMAGRLVELRFPSARPWVQAAAPGPPGG